MHPIYFPYTYIDRSMAVTLNECLGPVTVYQPSETQVPESMQQLAREGIIQLRTPVKGDDSRLARLLKDFHTWADLQRPGKGVDAAYLKTLKGRLPFFDDNSTSQIRAHIKARLGDRSADAGDAGGDDTLFKARIFLQLAQEFDLQSDQVADDLARFSQLEGELLKDLHGADEGGERPPSEKGIPGASETTYFMLAERIEAWATLMLADPHSTGPDAVGLWVTGNPDVVDWLSERFPEMQKVMDLVIPDGKQRICDQLEVLATADLDAGVRSVLQNLGSLSPTAVADADATGKPATEAHIYAIPEKTPTAVFTVPARPAASITPDERPVSPLRNTVVMFIRKKLAEIGE